jgi:hypothetical protein
MWPTCIYKSINILKLHHILFMNTSIFYCQNTLAHGIAAGICSTGHFHFHFLHILPDKETGKIHDIPILHSFVIHFILSIRKRFHDQMLYGWRTSNVICLCFSVKTIAKQMRNNVSEDENLDLFEKRDHIRNPCLNKLLSTTQKNGNKLFWTVQAGIWCWRPLALDNSFPVGFAKLTVSQVAMK